jgi:hypothetical protein
VLGPSVPATRAARYVEPPPRSRRWLAWVLVPLGLVALTVAVALLITRLVEPAPQAAGPSTFPTATTTPPTSAPPTSEAPTTTEAPTTEPPTSTAPATQPPTSGGPAQVRVPDVRGRRANVARNILQRLGLQVREFEIPTGDPRNFDRVIFQQPVNTDVPPNTVVNIGIGRRVGG